MTDFWDSHPDGKKDLLRLLTANGKWLAWPDKEADSDDAGSKRIAGCREQVEDKLNDALHSTNVVVLLGSGASFCAKNADGSKAPGMWHLWHAVRDGYGHAAFDQIVKDVMGDVPAEGKENIEGLLSLCKMSIELLRVQSKNDQGFTQRPKLESLENFIKAAEKTILEKVDFVKADTELVATQGLSANSDAAHPRSHASSCLPPITTFALKRQQHVWVLFWWTDFRTPLCSGSIGTTFNTTSCGVPRKAPRPITSMAYFIPTSCTGRWTGADNAMGL